MKNSKPHKTSDNTMASALKRKRGPGEVLETPKRAKSVKEIENTLPIPQLSQGGWDVAFNPPPKTKELIQTNGINGDGTHTEERSDSPEAVDYEVFVEEPEFRLEEKKQKNKKEKKLLKKVLSATEPDLWKLSEPIGGRQINVDPVFTDDEK